VYYPQILEDDSDVDYMFRLMVENNVTTRFSLDLILIVLCVINYAYM